MKNSLIIICSLFLLSSCELPIIAEDPLHETKIGGDRYIKFSNMDQLYLPNKTLETGAIIRFVNDAEEQLEFRVEGDYTRVMSKITYRSGSSCCGFSTFFSTPSRTTFHYNFDARYIRFLSTENSYLGEGLTIDFVYFRADDFRIYMDTPNWVETSESQHYKLPNYYNDETFKVRVPILNEDNLKSMEVGGEFFTRVVEVNANGSTTVSTDFIRLFYDYDRGLIRLDDLSGNNWERVFE